jgi:hypothetical protein
MSEVDPESIARNVCVFASAIATDWPRREKEDWCSRFGLVARPRQPNFSLG